MSKVKQFLVNRVENFKQASSFGKVWRITVYFVLVTVLVGPFLPAEEQTEPVAQENPTSEEWRQDQVEAAQEQAAKEEAAKEQAAQERVEDQIEAAEKAEKKEAARKAKVEASKTPEQKIEESLKDSLGDQYRASDITKRPDGYYVFVKFDATPNVTNGLTRQGIFLDAEDAIESLDEDVIDASFSAYWPAADGGDVVVLSADRLETDDGDANRMEHWDVGIINPDLNPDLQ